MEKILRAIEAELEAFSEVMDVSKFRELQGHLEKLLITDPVTGVLNRRKIQEVIEREICRSIQSKSPLYLMMIDIDSFKKINDGYGHNAGDEVLQRVAFDLEWIFEGKIGKTHSLGRWGGDEFIYVFPSVDLEFIKNKASLAIEKINCHVYSDQPLTVKISMGVAPLTSNNETAEKLIEDADKAMYKAKKQGGNRLEVMSSLSSK